MQNLYVAPFDRGSSGANHQTTATCWH